jgi:type I restriction enzyme S subunit
MMRSVKSQLKKSKWYEAKFMGKRVCFTPLAKVDDYKKYYDRYWSGRHEEIDKIIKLFEPLNTQQSEIIATLYGAWNDLLMGNGKATEKQIVEEVWERWHDQKKEISKDRWQAALKWMREKNLIPTGQGKQTKIMENNN